MTVDPATADTRRSSRVVVEGPERAAARSYLYSIGLTDEDLSGTGSDRFIDAVVAWGTDEQIRARLVAHLDAGADHVSVHILGALNDPTATESGLRRVADLMR